eukprot:403352883
MKVHQIDNSQDGLNKMESQDQDNFSIGKIEEDIQKEYIDQNSEIISYNFNEATFTSTTSSFLKRNLQATYLRSAELCVNSCLLQSRTFCLSADSTAGYCCSSQSSCPVDNICSYQIQGSVGVKAFSCPISPTCTAQTYSRTLPSYNGSILRISQQSTTSASLKLNSICKHSVRFNSSSGNLTYNSSFFTVRVKTLLNGAANFLISQTLTTSGVSGALNTTQDVIVRYPNMLNLAMVGNSNVSQMIYEIEVYFGAPPGGIQNATNSSTGTNSTTNTTTGNNSTSNTTNNTNTNGNSTDNGGNTDNGTGNNNNSDSKSSSSDDNKTTILIAVLASVGGVLLIGVICILCCCCGKKTPNRKNLTKVSIADYNNTFDEDWQKKDKDDRLHTVNPLMGNNEFLDDHNRSNGPDNSALLSNTITGLVNDSQTPGYSPDKKKKSQKRIGQDNSYSYSKVDKESIVDPQSIPLENLLHSEAPKPQPIAQTQNPINKTIDKYIKADVLGQVSQMRINNQIMYGQLAIKALGLDENQIDQIKATVGELPQYLQPEYLREMHSKPDHLVEFDDNLEQNKKVELLDFILQQPYLPKPLENQEPLIKYHQQRNEENKANNNYMVFSHEINMNFTLQQQHQEDSTKRQESFRQQQQSTRNYSTTSLDKFEFYQGDLYIKVRRYVR